MAQTTGSLTGALGKIEISFDDGSTWTDISGSTTSMDQVEYARSSGSKNTFGDAFAVVTVGKQLPTNIVVNALYTETTSEATDEAITGIKANTPCDLRWQYADVTTTPGAKYLQYITLGKSRVIKADLPEVNSESGEPATLSFTVFAPGIDYSEITVPTPP
jgi:hypothetical protein